MTSSSDPEAEKGKERREPSSLEIARMAQESARVGMEVQAKKIEAEARAAMEVQAQRDEAKATLKRFEAESEKAQLFFMLIILVVTISAGTILMGVSLFLPISFVVSNPNASPQVLQQINEAPKNVLPFATALVGFAGGLVTAIYGKSAYARSSQSPPSVVV
jgi:hypothetical protein